MDGSERIDHESVPEIPVVFEAQPAVIVEHVQMPEAEPEEEMVTELEVSDEQPPQQNGAGAEPDDEADVAVVTVDDIIADAVSAEDPEEQQQQQNESTMDTAEEGDGEEAEAAAEESLVAAENARPAKRKEPELDVNQCRCCTSKESLQNLFEPLKPDSSLLLSAVIAKLCPSVHIAKRDYLPNVICAPCVQRLQIAWQFKEDCERTDRELRKFLTRSQNKARQRVEYQLLDYATSDEEDQPADDDEFKLSDELAEEEPSDSDISNFSDAEAKRPRKRGRKKKSALAKASPAPAPVTADGVVKRGRGRPRKHPLPATPQPATPRALGKIGRVPIVYVEAKADSEEEEDDEEDEEEEEVVTMTVPVRRVTPGTARKVCAKCKEPVTRGIHKCKIKTEFACTFCAEKFGSHSLYLNHQQLHTNFQNSCTCIRCHKLFPSKFELRRHQSGVRCAKAQKNNCLACGRIMANAAQLAIHLRTSCKVKAAPAAAKGTPGKATPASAAKKVVAAAAATKKDDKGTKNLFKFVAPPTSTYWSDSFSD